MTNGAQLAAYYAARAAEYEDVYSKPERQAELTRLREVVAGFGCGRRVLELACGTGYWTSVLAPQATRVTATDLGEEVLAIARAKPLPGGRVTFQTADAFALDGVPGDFDSCFAGFWLSHIPRADIARFLGGLHQRLGFGACVLFVDNRYVEGSSTPISHTDADGNTYQRRVVATGVAYDVLKNFPTPREMRSQLATAGAGSVDMTELSYYWYARYEVTRAA